MSLVKVQLHDFSAGQIKRGLTVYRKTKLKHYGENSATNENFWMVSLQLYTLCTLNSLSHFDNTKHALETKGEVVRRFITPCLALIHWQKSPCPFLSRVCLLVEGKSSDMTSPM